MDKLEIEVDQTKTLDFKYLFSYIILKKILFLSKDNNEKDLTIASLITFNPAIFVESKTKKGIILKDNYFLASYFTPYSINSIIDLQDESIIIPETNFRSKLDASDFVIESKIKFLCSNKNIKLFISLEETPGVTVS